MITGWFARRRWRRSKHVTPAELEIVKALLPPNDERSERLLAQVTNAPEVHRKRIARSKYEMTIPYVLGHIRLLDGVEEDVLSPPIIISTRDGRRRLRFQLKVARGGFLYSLFGESVDGDDWELVWDADYDSLNAAKQTVDRNWLPEPISNEDRKKIVNKLLAWLEIEAAVSYTYDWDMLELSRAGNETEIAHLEHTEASGLPDEYKEFLQIVNGLALHCSDRPHVIHGTRDLYMTELGRLGDKFWVVASLYEEGIVAMRPAAQHDDFTYLAKPGTDNLERMTPFKEYVANCLELLRRGNENRTGPALEK